MHQLYAPTVSFDPKLSLEREVLPPQPSPPSHLRARHMARQPSYFCFCETSAYNRAARLHANTNGIPSHGQFIYGVGDAARAADDAGTRSAAYQIIIMTWARECTHGAPSCCCMPLHPSCLPRLYAYYLGSCHLLRPKARIHVNIHKKHAHALKCTHTIAYTGVRGQGRSDPSQAFLGAPGVRVRGG
jgi:hypothetical protein